MSSPSAGLPACRRVIAQATFRTDELKTLHHLSEGIHTPGSCQRTLHRDLGSAETLPTIETGQEGTKHSGPMSVSHRLRRPARREKKPGTHPRCCFRSVSDSLHMHFCALFEGVDLYFLDPSGLPMTRASTRPYTTGVNCPSVLLGPPSDWHSVDNPVLSFGASGPFWMTC